MTRFVLSVMALLAAACGVEETVETVDGDPECAFDETACVPYDLVFELRAEDDGASAVLFASFPTGEWEQQGTRGEMRWHPSDGTSLDEEGGGEVIPDVEPDRIAVRIDARAEGDAESVALRILRRDPADPHRTIGVKAESPLTGDPIRFRLENNAEYILHVEGSWPEGVAEFFFLVRVV